MQFFFTILIIVQTITGVLVMNLLSVLAGKYFISIARMIGAQGYEKTMLKV